jgi:hypothetical protein
MTSISVDEREMTNVVRDDHHVVEQQLVVASISMSSFTMTSVLQSHCKKVMRHMLTLSVNISRNQKTCL